MKKKKLKAKAKTKIELHSWVAPFGGAKHWESMIGEVTSVSKQKMALVVFRYKHDGSRLPKTEQWEFPMARLKLVPDFRARITKHAGNAASLGQADRVEDEFINLVCEEYIPPQI